MNNLSKISKDAIINITKSKGMYIVTIQPYNQVKQVFNHKKIKDAYKQVITFSKNNSAFRLDWKDTVGEIKLLGV